tara:strand:+ start:415 stop:651 length:237 start_codon:yes stop_codon:yes gene_type:complete
MQPLIHFLIESKRLTRVNVSVRVLSGFVMPGVPVKPAMELNIVDFTKIRGPIIALSDVSWNPRPRKSHNLLPCLDPVG